MKIDESKYSESEKKHPYREELELIFTLLYEKGVTLAEPGKEIEDAISDVMNVDAEYISFKTPDREKPKWIYFVLGNEPGVAMADYTVDPIFVEVADEVLDRMENPENLDVEELMTRTEPIINYYNQSDEPLDGDEVEKLSELIKNAINLHQGNITEHEFKSLIKSGSENEIKCIVSAVSASGEPDFYFVKVCCDQESIDNGEHYEAAKQKAADEGYGEPMLGYDENDPAGKAIASHFAWDTASVIEIKSEDQAMYSDKDFDLGEEDESEEEGLKA